MVHSAKCYQTKLLGVEVIDIISDRQFPRHAHDNYGIGLVLDGGHASWSGRGEVEAGPGHVITVNPNEIHCGRPVGTRARQWRMMFVDPAVLVDRDSTELRGRELTMPASDDPVQARMVAKALCVLTEVHSTEAECEEAVLDVFCQLLDRLGPRARDAYWSREVALMVERIQDCKNDAPGLRELSRLSGLTPTTALRRFRSEVGTTPHAYLIQARVRQARQAISVGASLADAAIDAGFADQSHMTRAFSRQFGISPGRWREAQFRSIP
jgi:AraC-like DNA-binding protein